MKRNTVILLHGNGDKTNIDNYKSIAVSNAISKMIEKCANNRIIKFTNGLNITNPNQYDLREFHHTSNSLGKSFANDSVDNNQKSEGIFIDLSKMFDIVNRKILPHKVENLGIREKASNFLKSYLQ